MRSTVSDVPAMSLEQEKVAEWEQNCCPLIPRQHLREDACALYRQIRTRDLPSMWPRQEKVANVREYNVSLHLTVWLQAIELELVNLFSPGTSQNSRKNSHQMFSTFSPAIIDFSRSSEKRVTKSSTFFPVLAFMPIQMLSRSTLSRSLWAMIKECMTHTSLYVNTCKKQSQYGTFT